MSSDVRLAAIKGFRLVTQNPERLRLFYEALGFIASDPIGIEAGEMEALGLTGCGMRIAMVLGESRLDLDCFEQPGLPYPADADAADLVFQHLALATSDAGSAWSNALAGGAMAISRTGPVTLPPSAGGVTAVKFRDPDGHPLELLEFPAGSNSTWQGHGMLGIDHSAVSVATIDDSFRFYTRHGLKVGDRTLNHGPSQIALDGLDDVVVDVVPMNPSRATPHIELLRYRTPSGRTFPPSSPNDVAATRIVWVTDQETLLRDPDGHLHQLTR
ncbi:glyoxalase [Sphingomonas sp. CGMCC 1.13654]|uniref:Glyoxalase n=1 Tax=Sphingomonas chungangi TaxID=2683589 RepID=A0A838LCJ7_9SPHN|nr:glyoxalase [Sphingomonas chungangi]MBA2935208.1 glyoxalase [Sphingomonas chungangi]MVW55286.1 glyoxalase [Sphingomonas chungangi]